MISVTQALSPFYKQIDKMRPGVLEHATERGSWVHTSCSLIARDLVVAQEIPPEYQGYIDSFEKWLNSQVKEVISVELRLEDSVFGLCGHLDYIVILRDGLSAIVDLKTPLALSKLWRAQLSGYLHLAVVNNHKIDKVGSLRLNPDGKAPKMDWYEGTAKEDFAIFLSALNAYRNLMV